MIVQEDGRWRSVRTLDEQLTTARERVAELSPAERRALQQILDEYNATGDSPTAEAVAAVEWDEQIVPVREWLADRDLVGETGQDMYPKLRDDLVELFEGEYSEVVLTGSIGWGKDYFATTAIMRLLYELNCLKNPQHTLGLAAGEPIHIVPISKTVAAARRVVFGGICKKLALSKWFQGRYEETMEEVRFKKKGIYIVGGASTDSAALGLNTIGSIVDECLTGDAVVETDAGPRRIDLLCAEFATGARPFAVVSYADGKARISRAVIKQASVTDVFAVVFSDGRSVTGTERHPFLVLRPSGEEEYVFLRDLRPGDLVVTVEADCSPQMEPAIPPAEVRGVGDLRGSRLADGVENKTAYRVGVIPVLSVTWSGVEQTYDLYCPDYGNFVANGVVVHNTNFLGEGKVSTGSASSKAEDKATMIYNALARRVKSRFRRHGVRGLVILISSKRSTSDFTERRIRQAIKEGDSTLFVRDHAIWHVHPEPFENQKWHRVYVSPKAGHTRLLQDNEAEPTGDPESLVFKFPEDFLPEFKTDPDGATRDYGGVSTDFTGQLFIGNRTAIEDAQDPNRVHPFAVYEWCHGQILVGNWGKVLTKNLHNEPVPVCCPGAARHVHIDISAKHCATGFCVGHQGGAEQVERHDPETHEKTVETVPVIHIDCVLKIVAPDGGDIDHAQVRGLVYRMIEKGYPITSVSMDQFSAPPNLQLFKQRGLRVEEVGQRRFFLRPHLTLRQALYEHRIHMPVYDLLAQELKGLEIDKSGAKITHPPKGSSDLVDSLAGVVYYLSEHMKLGGALAPTPGKSFQASPGSPVWTEDGGVLWGDEERPPSKGAGSCGFRLG